MPELPEVETIRRELARQLPGVKILEVTRAEPIMLRGLAPEDLRTAVEGRRFVGVTRHGKLLRLDVEGGPRLEVHLGMSGRLGLEPWDAPAQPHTHVEFRLEDGRALRFRDPRRFGRWSLVHEGRRSGQVFIHGGPDPLSLEFDAPALHRILSTSRAEIKRLLLDQARIAGLGNIYACEALWRAGIEPMRRGCTLSVAETGRLYLAIRELLASALEHRGTTFSDYRDASGNPGGFQRRLAVYNREGEPCPRCGRAVKRILQGGRSTFCCPGCQTRRGFRKYSYLTAVRGGDPTWGRERQ